MDETEHRFGGVDVVVNTAGVTRRSPLADADRSGHFRNSGSHLEYNSPQWTASERRLTFVSAGNRLLIAPAGGDVDVDVGDQFRQRKIGGAGAG